jgi:hypothetical protein
VDKPGGVFGAIFHQAVKLQMSDPRTFTVKKPGTRARCTCAPPQALKEDVTEMKKREAQNEKLM